LVDGNIFRDFDTPGESVVKGDAISSSIAAASILAKVTRDILCDELDALYPGYGIQQHKGYGTKAHMDALRRMGPSPCHRKQFIRFLDKTNL
jgi:ribonuclease HII